MIIRRIGVFSAAKITAIIAAAFGLLAGCLIFAMSSVTGPAMQQAAQSDPGMAWVGNLGALAIIALPIFYGIVGFIAGAIQAFVFNLAAKFVGGLHIETE